MSRPAGARAFTLVELLVVTAILSMLAAVLVPVLSQARGKARQAVCLSNQRQLGLALLAYVQDYDESFPNGVNWNAGGRVWPGEGWAGQCQPYVRSPLIYRCLEDPQAPRGPHDWVESYGYNINLVEYADEPSDPPPAGLPMSRLDSPPVTVMLFEVSGVTVNLSAPLEGEGGPLGADLSATSNGLDNRLYAQEYWGTSIQNQYATGLLGGRQPFNAAATQFQQRTGRHAGGADYLLADGHIKWLTGAAVSAGLDALGPTCDQDNLPAAAGCGGEYYAAGAEDTARRFAATFSTE